MSSSSPSEACHEEGAHCRSKPMSIDVRLLDCYLFVVNEGLNLVLDFLSHVVAAQEIDDAQTDSSWPFLGFTARRAAATSLLHDAEQRVVHEELVLKEEGVIPHSRLHVLEIVGQQT
eukprot:CAMPEP_0206454082 /NCGR_PEP_ID=MMETSP0324_2-20121206/20932_1 /ASSEMBLY_ACC=CAM_ASM_000836 /TAXON_ID=2866 /ORGANISM="Crypthecodinium cohnii, Strain Seligo" /LENGTH=116 /DNA_ID=CAMNT_0053924501 /DNA_START=20 /DNA_END=370 /DNA_ORIENTATION=-